jgi:hypothetical protein
MLPEKKAPTRMPGLISLDPCSAIAFPHNVRLGRSLRCNLQAVTAPQQYGQKESNGPVSPSKRIARGAKVATGNYRLIPLGGAESGWVWGAARRFWGP